MKIENVLQIKEASGFTYYLGTIAPSQIMELTFVPCVVKVNEDVLNVRTHDGYQREGDPKRMKSIADFYAGHESSIIPPVLLSTRGAWKFTPSTRASSVGTIQAEDCAAVIDGQHRLGGLSMLAQRPGSNAGLRSIPFMAVEFPKVETEAEEFEVINDRQKGIKKSHLKYIKKAADFTGNAADMLKEDEDSVFYGRIGISDRHDWDLITFGAACELVDLTFDNYFCKNTNFRPKASDEHQAKAMYFLQNYWKQVSLAFSEMWSDIGLMPTPGSPKSSTYPGRSKFEYRILEETGLRALAILGSRVLNRAWIGQSEDVAWQTVEDLLHKVAHDSTVRLVMQKLTGENRTAILQIDPKFQMQGKAGVTPLVETLLGVLDRG